MIFNFFFFVVVKVKFFSCSLSKAARDPAAFDIELKTEQILTGCRADQKKKNGAGSRADFKILPFLQFYAVFMPFSCR